MSRFLSFLFLFSTLFISAQKPSKPSSAAIFEDIKKLNFLGTALYIAAHPDDENTSLISYLANDVKARTGYLSLTRGDGGQNLIGPEIRELLGVIRTQELLAARRTDGGEQLFSRANDFGYSKHPDETLKIWNKEEVLGDVVLAIRKFRPDIIINRFSHDPTSFGRTHGHHSSSAVLSTLAFNLVGDASKYPDQLNKVAVWQPKRQFFNTSHWFYGGRDKFNKVDKSNFLKIETGTFYPSYGLSNGEVASLSRSMHKSQGFGSTGSRGSANEYLEFIQGDFKQGSTDLFEGINTTWTRVKGGKEIIRVCSGIYIEAVAGEPSATKGDDINVSVEAINRSSLLVTLESTELLPLNVLNNDLRELPNNTRLKFNLKGSIPLTLDYTSPYWLTEKGSLGMYKVPSKSMIGLPETPRAIQVDFRVRIEGESFSFVKEVVFKYNDPVKGEVYKPFEITPAVTSEIADKVIIFVDGSAKKIEVKVKSGKSNVKGKLELGYPKGWSVEPKYYDIVLEKKGEEQSFSFNVTPSKNQSEGKLKPVVMLEGKKYTNSLVEIDYDHIPFQSVLMPAESKVVRLDIHKQGQLIGYIQGAGDDIPVGLRQIGYTVVELNEDEITLDGLSKFDAVVLGVRAYNTNEKSKFYQNKLHSYVENGGTLLVQYNTSHRVKVDNVAPLELKLSRDRVTDENSVVRIINPTHEVMQSPNQITLKDFDGWVQERGLYFPNKWSDEFSSILSMNDEGKEPLEGSLLVANYGKGYFIYTGLSFFRELPAGVSGAYRIYANLLSIGKNNN